MTRRKHQFFDHNARSSLVIEVGKPLYKSIKGNWRRDYFGNDHRMVLELACGKGEYTIGLARAFPDVNFVGVDIKGDRIARGASTAGTLGLKNVAFLRTDINYLTEFFADGEVDEIWVTFPDPQPRPKQEKHRLTHPRFLATYRQLLVPGGLFHLKTDSAAFFDYSLETIRGENFTDLQYTTDLYNSPLNAIHLSIRTAYEKMFTDQGFTINYLQSKTGVTIISHPLQG